METLQVLTKINSRHDKMVTNQLNLPTESRLIIFMGLKKKSFEQFHI